MRRSSQNSEWDELRSTESIKSNGSDNSVLRTTSSNESAGAWSINKGAESEGASAMAESSSSYHSARSPMDDDDNYHRFEDNSAVGAGEDDEEVPMDPRVLARAERANSVPGGVRPLDVQTVEVVEPPEGESPFSQGRRESREYYTGGVLLSIMTSAVSFNCIVILVQSITAMIAADGTSCPLVAGVHNCNAPGTAYLEVCKWTHPFKYFSMAVDLNALLMIAYHLTCHIRPGIEPPPLRHYLYYFSTVIFVLIPYQVLLEWAYGHSAGWQCGECVYDGEFEATMPVLFLMSPFPVWMLLNVAAASHAIYVWLFRDPAPYVKGHIKHLIGYMIVSTFLDGWRLLWWSMWKPDASMVAMEETLYAGKGVLNFLVFALNMKQNALEYNPRYIDVHVRFSGAAVVGGEVKTEEIRESSERLDGASWRAQQEKRIRETHVRVQRETCERVQEWLQERSYPEEHIGHVTGRVYNQLMSKVDGTTKNLWLLENRERLDAVIQRAYDKVIPRGSNFWVELSESPMGSPDTATSLKLEEIDSTGSVASVTDRH